MSFYYSDLKVILAGDYNTGKTSFLNKFTHNIFSDTYKPTKISEFGFKTVENNGKNYKLQIWDLADCKGNFTIPKIFAKDSHGCIIFVDHINIKYGEYILKLKKAIEESSGFNEKLPFILVETKSDLLDENEEKIHEKELKKFAEINGFEQSFLVSCKTGFQIHESFEFLIDLMIKRIDSLLKKGIKVFKHENKNKGKDNKYYKKLIEEEFKSKNIKKNLKLISFDNIEGKIFKIYINDEHYDKYQYEIEFLKLKEKYEFFECLYTIDELIEALDKLIEKKRIKVNFVLEKKMISISAFFCNIYGEEKEILFDLIHEKYNKKELFSELIKKAIRLKKGKF